MHQERLVEAERAGLLVGVVGGWEVGLCPRCLGERLKCRLEVR